MLQKLGKVSPRNQRILLTIGCALLFCVWFCRVPFIEPDEVRYAEATREMVATGNYIIPYYNGQPRYQKPIFYYWVQSMARLTLGPSEAAARFPSAIFGLALVLLLHGFLLRWLMQWAHNTDETTQLHARGAAFLGGISLALLPLIAVWTRTALTDLTLTFFITGAMLSLLQAALVDEHKRRWYFLAAAFCGMAFLTKGPMGILLPGLVWIAYHLKQRTLISEAKRVPWIAAIFILLLINLPWYLSAGEAFLKQFFFTENANRYMSGPNGHKDLLVHNLLDFLGFLASIAFILFPFIGVLVRDLRNPFSGNAILTKDNFLSRIRCFSWCWIGSVVVFFALAQTRFLNYIQSIAAAVIIVATLHIFGRLMPSRDIEQVENNKGKILENTVQIFFGIIWIAVVNFAIWSDHALLRKWAAPYPETLALITRILVVTVSLALLGTLAAWIRSNSSRAFSYLLMAWGGFFAISIVLVIPLFVASTFGPVADVGTYLKHLPAKEKVISYYKKEPEGLIYYSQRQDISRHVDLLVPQREEHIKKIIELLSTNREIIVVTNRKDLVSLSQFGHTHIIKQYPFFIVVRLIGSSLPTRILK